MFLWFEEKYFQFSGSKKFKKCYLNAKKFITATIIQNIINLQKGIVLANLKWFSIFPIFIHVFAAENVDCLC